MLIGASLTIFPLIFQVATCPHKDCKIETTVRDLPKHKRECPYRMEQCRKDCHLQFPFYKLEGHDCFRALRDTVDGKISVDLLHQYCKAES